MLFGYARVSTPEQSLSLQVDALINAGCSKENIYKEVASGAKSDRPELSKMLSFLRKGDTVVVWKLDRLGRSLSHLIELAKQLEIKGVELKILQQNIDTSAAIGRMYFQLCAMFAEFEREMIRERTNAGLAAARARGRVGGRRRALSDKKIEHGKTLAADKSRRIKDICETLKCSPATYYRYVHGKVND